MTERSAKEVTHAAVNRLCEETGLPFWKPGEKPHAQKPYAVMITIPGVRSMYAGEEYQDFLTTSGLDKGGNAVLYEKESVKKEHRVEEYAPPSDFTLVLQGKTEQEFEAVVNSFCNNFLDHPELKNAWLKSNPSGFMDALKGAVKDGGFGSHQRLLPEQFEVLDSIVYPPNSYELQGFLEHLSKLAVAQDAPKQAVQASQALDILSEHVPLLRDEIYKAREQSRLPAMPSETAGTKYLTAHMEIAKDDMVEINPFNGFYFRSHGDKMVAKISNYKVKFHCDSRKDAEELVLHVQEALKEVAKSRPEFNPTEYTEGRPTTRTQMTGYSNIYVHTEDDGKTVTFSPPLILDDLWKMYDQLKDVIKPTYQVAKSMDWARHAEYRSPVGGYSESCIADGFAVDSGNLRDPAMQRGAGYDNLEEGQRFNAMLADIAGMLGTTKDVETAGAQIIQLSHLAASGVVTDKDHRYPDVYTALPGMAKGRAVSTNAYAGLVAEYTDRLARDMVGALQASGVEIDTAKSLSEQLEQAATQMEGPLKARDDSVFQERVDALNERHRERWIQYERDGARRAKEKADGTYKPKPLFGEGWVNSFAGDKVAGTALISLTGGLGKAKEREEIFIDRPYPMEGPNEITGNYTVAKPVYWSRSGENSAQPPRFELPKELQASIDAYRAQGEWARQAQQAKLPAPSVLGKK